MHSSSNFRTQVIHRPRTMFTGSIPALSFISSVKFYAEPPYSQHRRDGRKCACRAQVFQRSNEIFLRRTGFQRCCRDPHNMIIYDRCTSPIPFRHIPQVANSVSYRSALSIPRCNVVSRGSIPVGALLGQPYNLRESSRSQPLLRDKEVTTVTKWSN